MTRCRICWEDTLPLFELPCECKGDLRLIHRPCFEKWINHFAGGRQWQCDVCGERILHPLPDDARALYQNHALCPFRNLARVAFIFFLYYVLALAGFAATWCIQVLRDSQLYSPDIQVTAVFIFTTIVCTFALVTACSRPLFVAPVANVKSVDVAAILLPWHPMATQETIKCAQ